MNAPLASDGGSGWLPATAISGVAGPEVLVAAQLGRVGVGLSLPCRLQPRPITPPIGGKNICGESTFSIMNDILARCKSYVEDDVDNQPQHSSRLVVFNINVKLARKYSDIDAVKPYCRINLVEIVEKNKEDDCSICVEGFDVEHHMFKTK
ncbi:hypothetical protein AKJ16_DCAP22093 [Drosera capensis]